MAPATEPTRTPWRTSPREHYRNATEASVCLGGFARNRPQLEWVSNRMRRILRLCVYCGSSDAVDRQYREAASELGASLAAAGGELIYGGGGGGLMGLVRRGTFGG